MVILPPAPHLRRTQVPVLLAHPFTQGPHDIFNLDQGRPLARVFPLQQLIHQCFGLLQ